MQARFSTTDLMGQSRVFGACSENHICYIIILSRFLLLLKQLAFCVLLDSAVIFCLSLEHGDRP